MNTSRKTALIRILESLQGYWSLAKGFLFLIQSSDDESLVEKLYTIIKQQISNIHDQTIKSQIQSQLEKLKNYQRYAYATDQADHQEADKLLDDLYFNQ